MSFAHNLGQHIPENESTTTMQWINSIDSLERYADNFANDIRLFEYAAQRGLEVFLGKSPAEEPSFNIANWMFIACRDGAMQIYHFGKILDTLNTRLRKCPTLASHVDGNAIKQANRIFKSTFKDHEGVRHSVGHQAEVILSPERNSPHGAMMVDCLSDRYYMTTYEGRILGYEISVATLDNLHKTHKRIKDALTPVLEHALSLPPGQSLALKT